MKSTKLAIAALGLLAAPLLGQAATGTLTVSATVISKSVCKFQAGSGTVLGFGNIDPSSGTNATGSVTLVVRCGGSAATAAFTVSADDGLYSTGPGQPRMRHAVNTAEFLPYALNAPVSGTVPKNTDTNVVISGTITPAQFANALVGNFADTVVLTLTP